MFVAMSLMFDQRYIFIEALILVRQRFLLDQSCIKIIALNIIADSCNATR